jgi:hypothetical protein
MCEHVCYEPRGLVGSIFRGRWCVVSTCLCLLQLRERSKQRSGNFGIACLRVSLGTIFNVSCIGYLISHGAPSLHTSSFRHPAAAAPTCLQTACTLDNILPIVQRTL